MDVPSNIITNFDVTMGVSSNVVNHCDVIMSGPFNWLISTGLIDLHSEITYLYIT